jgi:hypothetical protein
MQLSPKMQGEKGGESISVRLFEQGYLFKRCLLLSKMSDEQLDLGKELSSPFSTGSGGPRFENQVQSLFVVLMLTGGIVPGLPPLPINRIKLQGRYDGYNTDDFIAFVEGPGGEQKAKLLAQIKHSINITENDPDFGEVIKAAWLDLNNAEAFDKSTDVFALITGPLSATDSEVRTILEWARTSETAEEFLKKVSLGRFSSATKQKKLAAFRVQLQKANNGVDIGDERLLSFLKSFHLLPCDLDISSAFLRSAIAQFTNTDPGGIFELVAREVGSFNQSAGTLTRDTVAPEIKSVFSERVPQIPEQYAPVPDKTTPSDYSKSPHLDALTFASLLGAWNENVEGDREVIRKLIETND